MHNIASISVTVSAPDTTYDPPNRVRVKVSYTYIPTLYIFKTAPTLTTYAEGRMEVQ